MKRAIKHTSNIYEYLEASGVLDNGTDEEIKAARKAYWDKYRAAYRRKMRKEQDEFTVSFNKKEMRILKPVVEKHRSSYTRFIKQATLAYIQQQYVVIDPASINSIRELLTKNYTTLQNIEERHQEKHSTEALRKLEMLEKAILQMLLNPKVLEQAITEAIREDPNTKHKILNIIEKQ